jgi:hypothetical protein
MLFLAGRFAQPLKFVIGVVLVVLGVVMHHLFLWLVGAALLLWGAGALLASARNRGQGTG